MCSAWCVSAWDKMCNLLREGIEQYKQRQQEEEERQALVFAEKVRLRVLREQQEREWIAAEAERVRAFREQAEREWIRRQEAEAERVRALREQEEERRRQEEEEGRRRLAAQRAAQRRRQAEEAERLRALREQEEERRRQQEEEAAEDLLTAEIDLHIRTRRKFDCRSPQAYWCALQSIAQGKEVREALEGLQGFYDVTLQDFIAEDPSFKLSKDGTKARVRHLTPFQGGKTHRVYGYFVCGGCQRGWESAATWVDSWQKCKGCEAKNYPYEQRFLEQRQEEEGTDERRPHDMTRCQRCRELGRICVPSMYYSHTG